MIHARGAVEEEVLPDFLQEIILTVHPVEEVENATHGGHVIVVAAQGKNSICADKIAKNAIYISRYNG